MLIDMGVQSGDRCFATQRLYGLVLQLQRVTKSLLYLFIYIYIFCKKEKMIVDELVFVLLFNCCIQ